MSDEFVHLFERESAGPELLKASTSYETRFDIRFDIFATFSKEMLNKLHSLDLNANDHVHTPSRTRTEVPMATLTRIANQHMSKQQRTEYLTALLDIYESLPEKPDSGSELLTIAPMREGYLLSKELGWFPSSGIAPQMKRIPLTGGLTVGSTSLPTFNVHTCNIIDGAIASGSTIITLVEMLQKTIKKIRLFVVHATAAGLAAIGNYCKRRGIELVVYVGVVSGTLNEKYYAVDDRNPSRLIVGDLGDAIAPILA